MNRGQSHLGIERSPRHFCLASMRIRGMQSSSCVQQTSFELGDFILKQHPMRFLVLFVGFVLWWVHARRPMLGLLGAMVVEARPREDFWWPRRDVWLRAEILEIETGFSVMPVSSWGGGGKIVVGTVWATEMSG